MADPIPPGDLPSNTSMLALFADIGRTLTSTRTLDEVLRAIMEKVNQLLTPRNWSLLMIDPATHELEFTIAVGPGAEGLQGRRLPVGKGICGWVAEKGEPLLIYDVSKDPRFNDKFDKESNFKTQSIICVPMKSKGNVLGVIELINMLDEGRGRRESAFSQQDMDILGMLADFAAIAVENARYIERIESLTVTDEATGLRNMRYLQEMLDREVSRALRHKLELSLVFLDLDRFKSVNDRWGHPVGTAALRETAEVLKRQLRESDVAVRYGGDEFVVLLPDTGKTNALLVAERLRAAVEANQYRAGEETFRLSASFGVAGFPADAADKNELIQRADQALYRSKETGRNKITSAG